MRKGIILWGLRLVGSVRFGVHTWTLWVCRSGRGTLFRQTCFAIALDECVLHRYVTERLRFDPVPQPEMGIVGDEYPSFMPRFVQPTQLRYPGYRPVVGLRAAARARP